MKEALRAAKERVRSRSCGPRTEKERPHNISRDFWNDEQDEEDEEEQGAN